jgi:hypothetical protein
MTSTTATETTNTQGKEEDRLRGGAGEMAQEQVVALARRDHPPDHEASVAGDAHETGRSGNPISSDRDVDRREPQVPLGEPARAVRRPTGRVGRPVHRSQVMHPLPEDGHPALPADPLSDDARRYPGIGGQQPPDVGLDRVDGRARRLVFVLRRRCRRPLLVTFALWRGRSARGRMLASHWLARHPPSMSAGACVSRFWTTNCPLPPGHSGWLGQPRRTVRCPDERFALLSQWPS